MRVTFFRTTIRVGLLAVGLCPAAWSAGPCAGTPVAAVKAFETGLETRETTSEGYRVTRMHRDVVLGTRWATVERCGHPEWPGTMVPVAGSGTDVSARVEATRVGVAAIVAPPKVVRAGETVRLWRQDPNVRMQMAAVSEEGGAAGDRIRMRVTAQQEYGESVRYVYGLVRGPADVEME